MFGWAHTLQQGLADRFAAAVGRQRARILIVHGEGNVFNNPNLYDIVNFLGKRFRVDVLVPVRSFNKARAFPSRAVRLIEYLPLFGDFRFLHSSDVLDSFCARYVREEYHLVIGVDRDGLILASLLAGRLGLRYGMISYEIFFEEETSTAFKAPERHASARLSFVVAPDQSRAEHLTRENQIPANTGFLHIPVAPARSFPYRRSNFLRKSLGIPADKRVLVFAGSVARWTGIEEVLMGLNAFPDDWVLVLHDRYGDTRAKVESLAGTTLQTKVYISDIDIPSNNDMHRLLHSADLGLALYSPDPTNMWVGKNLGFVGMSSGKTCVYLQHGLPVVITHDAVLSPLIEAHRLGYTVTGADELGAVLRRHRPCRKQRRRCARFFEEVLSLNRYKAPLLEVVEEHLAHGDGQPRGLNEQPLFELLRGAVAAPQQVVHWSIEDLTVWVEQIRGTGERFLIYGEDALGLTIEALMPDRFVAFVDYKSDRMSTDILAGKVYSPLNLPNMAYDRIIVGLLGQEIHAEQHLVKDLGVPKDKAVRVLC